MFLAAGKRHKKEAQKRMMLEYLSSTDQSHIFIPHAMSKHQKEDTQFKDPVTMDQATTPL